MPSIYTQRGQVSAYGLACGYADVYTMSAESGDVEVRLTDNGCTYDVKVIAHGQPLTWFDLPDGRKVLAGWAQFDKLADARKFHKRLALTTSVGMAYAECLTQHYN